MLQAKVPRKVSLRTVLIVPFFIQILVAVGLTGWLSFRNGQKAVNTLASDLSREVTARIDQRVQDYLSQPHLIHQVTTATIRSGNLNLANFPALERYFWHQVGQAESGTTFAFGNEKGEFVAVRKEEERATLILIDQSTGFERVTYALDSQGNPIRPLTRIKADPRDRPWYQAAAQAGKPTWSPIFLSVIRQPGLFISAVNPIYNETGQLYGVLTFGLNLSQISDFLQSLKISKSGQAFIIERSGEIVASSAAEPPFMMDGNELKRLPAIKSSNPLIQSTAQHLLDKFGKLNPIHSSQSFILGVNDQRKLVQITPLQDGRGLDWLVVVVIPETDFMAEIKANTRATILLCLASLIVAILFGLQTTRWIARPILSLNKAAKKLSEGEWEQSLPEGHFSEIGELAQSFNSMTAQLKELFATLEQKVKQRTAELAKAIVDLEKSNTLIRQVFGRYLTDEVVANLLESPERLKLGGERRTITILTSDLRGFTPISERLSPEEVVNVLNFYFYNMANVITKYQGTIDEFMGDGILVLFGAPTIREDDAVRAVACAIEMQLTMATVNRQMREWGLPILEMGIGINTGEVVVGNIGSDKRTKYGVVGSPVNLAYRIESYTVGGQILISESTFKATEAIVKVNGQKQVQPKGVQSPIPIYEVGGMGGVYNLFLHKEDDIFFPLTEPIPLQYTILDGKHIGNAVFPGSLIKLSARGAEIRADTLATLAVPSEMSNIKLNLLETQHGTGESVAIYAKVLKNTAKELRSFYVYFTAKPPEVAAKLDALYKLISSR